jgi:hypothetical protein
MKLKYIFTIACIQEMYIFTFIFLIKNNQVENTTWFMTIKYTMWKRESEFSVVLNYFHHLPYMCVANRVRTSPPPDSKLMHHRQKDENKAMEHISIGINIFCNENNTILPVNTWPIFMLCKLSFFLNKKSHNSSPS